MTPKKFNPFKVSLIVQLGKKIMQKIQTSSTPEFEKR